ncbi:winged helix-turn-helix transcriptional regulator [Nocardia testacea]|uniref:Winged helix-turn-helix transcriptional regulator n=1 Tax=Nocardia testacea TaxID=248551 RepID=A0ABW7VU96_9NOCA
MAGKRWYNDGCAAAHAFDLIGDRWALPVVRELMLGPKRFTDLRGGLPGASADILSQRLRELKEVGIVRQYRLPPPAAARVYELTEWGSELSTAVTELARWAAKSPLLRRDIHSSVDSLMLSLHATFDEEAAAGFTAAVALRFGDNRFRVQVTHGRLQVDRGEFDDPDVVVETDSHVFDDVLYGKKSLDDAVRSGALTIEGSIVVAQRFLELFTYPAPLDVTGGSD